MHLPCVDDDRINLALFEAHGPALWQSLRSGACLAGVPALLCSAEAGPSFRKVAANAVFDGCCAKPLDRHGLRREIAATRFAAAG